MNTTLEIPGIARLVTGRGGLTRYEITTPVAEAHIYLHGAQISHYARTGQPPLLFLSAESYFEPGKPIRGGVPVIFPWFGPRQGHPESPAHAFARLQTWTAESIVPQPDGSVEIVLRLEPHKEAREMWGGAHDWVLRHRIIVGETLTMRVEIENRGTAPLPCEEALHTYFSVSDVRDIEIRGLEGMEYYDKTDNSRRKRQDMQPIRFTGEMDRIYVNTATPVVIVDPGLHRRIVIEKADSQSTVVWNPHIAKAKALPDYGDNEWPGMVCVESGNVVDNRLEIAPGAMHATQTVLRTEPI